MAAPLLHVRASTYRSIIHTTIPTATATTTNALATRNMEQGDHTSKPLEVIDNNGEVVFAIAVTTHK
jgi:hypothetical protein